MISGTRYRVQNQFFRASTQDSSYPATSARLDGTSWCSLSTDSLLRPYLEITFGTAVNISTLRIGGYAAIFGDAHFVTKFRVLVDSTGGSLSPIFSSGNTLVCCARKYMHALRITEKKYRSLYSIHKLGYVRVVLSQCG